MSGRFDRPAVPAGANGASPAGGTPRLATSEDVSPEEVRARRDVLARELAERQWDLGGLTYEMAIRDHFRLDVLVQKAGELQEIDAELGEVERILTLEESAASGMCSACGAPHSRGAVFCWQCGAQLMPRTTPGLT